MAGGVEVARGIAIAPALAVGGRFKGFRPETERSSSKAEVQETEALRVMKAAWRACGYDIYIGDRNYSSILQIVENLQYTATELEDFSIAIAEFQQEESFYYKAGLFLSALINSGNDSHFSIHTQHLGTPLACLGFRNEKNIIVEGNAGFSVGRKMGGGSITVRGNTGYGVGEEMKGGDIIVEGNAGSGVGWKMKNGGITIKGNAGWGVGYWMRGGVIRLEGEYECLRDIKGGRVYHKWKLIYPSDGND